MDRRCLICNDAISEENIMGQIEFDFLDAENLFEYEEIEPGIRERKAPERLQGGIRLVVSEQGDWRHYWCQAALGSGMTAEEMIQQFMEGIQSLEQ